MKGCQTTSPTPPNAAQSVTCNLGERAIAAPAPAPTIPARRGWIILNSFFKPI